MSKFNKLVLIVIAVALVITGFAFLENKPKEATKSDTIKIGILQLIDQKALNDAKVGFEKEIKKADLGGKKVKFDFLNAQGDQSNLRTMSERLKKDKNTLNLAIATPAAQALQKIDPDTPMLFTAITDPKNAGIVDNIKKPTTNATGVTDMVDVAGQIEFIHKLFPQAKKIGLFYNAAEPNSVIQIKIAKKKIAELGLTPVEKTAATTNDVEQAITALAHQSDAIYIPTDNIAAASMPTIGKVSEKVKTPVVNADATMIQFAGVATRGINYEDLGKQAAKMAIKIIKGEKVENIAVEAPEKTSLVTSDRRMKLFNITMEQLKKIEEK